MYTGVNQGKGLECQSKYFPVKTKEERCWGGREGRVETTYGGD